MDTKSKCLNSSSLVTNESCPKASGDDLQTLMAYYLPAQYLMEDHQLDPFWVFRLATSISAVYLPLCSGLGIAGNFLSLLVMQCGRMTRSTTLTYMTALAICDITVEMIYFGPNTEKLLGYSGHASSVNCFLGNFVFYFSSHSSVLLTVLMTAERYLGIKQPLKVHSREHAAIIVFAVLLLSCSLNVHFFFSRALQWNDHLQKHICAAVKGTGEFFMLKIWPYFPFASLSVLNILIFRHIRKSDRFFFACNAYQTRIRDRRSTKSLQITAMLLAVTMAFLVMVGPMGVYLIAEQNILTNSSASDKAKLMLARSLANCLASTNHAINFVLYLVSGSHFRKEALGLLCRLIARVHNLKKAFKT